MGSRDYRVNDDPQIEDIIRIQGIQRSFDPTYDNVVTSVLRHMVSSLTASSLRHMAAVLIDQCKIIVRYTTHVIKNGAYDNSRHHNHPIIICNVYIYTPRQK